VFVDGRVLVGFHDGVSLAARRRIERAISTSTPRQITPALDLLPISSGHVLAAIRALKAQPEVRYAEPDYVARSSGAPNDPFFGQQWGFSNAGQLVNGTTGTAGADEHAVPAWSVATGSRSVVIAETDTGVDYNHPDLAGNIWSNPGGVGGCPAGTHGYNVISGTCYPMDDDTYYGGHGTHVAGIMGAQGNNGVGVTGVNWSTSILPVKWLDANSSDPSGSSSGLIAAMDWILRAKRDYNVNVRVLNDSATFVGTAYSQALSDEIDALGAKDILFVTAAGNTGDNNDDPAVRRYPCGYDRPTEICVTASDQYDQKPSWANYGATTVDLAAPGANIYSTLRNGAYGYISGGSMASPQVAGTAALVLARQDMTTTDLKAEILNHVDVLPSLNGLVRTGGRLDVCKALPGCPGAPVISSPADGTSTNSSMVTLSGSAEPGSSIEVFDGSTPQATMTTDGSGRWSDAMTAVADGQHSYTARATVAGGSTSAASAPVVHVTVNTHEPVAPSSSAPTTAPTSPAPTTAPTSPAPVGPASASGPRSVAPVAASQADGAVAARSSIRALARRLARAGPLALLRLGGSHPLALRWPQAGRYSLSWSARTPPSAADRVARGTGRRRRAKLMVVLIGGGSATRTEAGPGGLALTLTGAGRRYLRMVKTGRTLLQATFQPANGTQATIVSIVVFVAGPRNHARSKR